MMLSEGWAFDEPWTPLHHDLYDPVPDTLVTRAGLRVEVIGPDRAHSWMEVHWSAFKGTPFGEAERRDVVDWWSTMMDGPFADRGRSLAVFGPDGRAVAIVGVWSAGRGRPGLVEPMGCIATTAARAMGQPCARPQLPNCVRWARPARSCAPRPPTSVLYLPTPRQASPHTRLYRTCFDSPELHSRTAAQQGNRSSADPVVRGRRKPCERGTAKKRVRRTAQSSVLAEPWQRHVKPGRRWTRAACARWARRSG